MGQNSERRERDGWREKEVVEDGEEVMVRMSFLNIVIRNPKSRERRAMALEPPKTKKKT